MIKVGDHLPKFEGLNQDGELLKSENYLGQKLIVFFYPQASTPTCTVEACNLNSNYAELKKAGYQLLGISADGVAKQKKFHERNKFEYDLLADETKEAVNAFGVWQQKKTFGKEYMGIVRTTFVFDENGVCTRVIDKVKSKEAAAQILEG